MKLAFDKFGEYRLAGILDDGIAQYFDRTGLAINFYVNHVGTHARSATCHVDFGMTRNGATEPNCMLDNFRN